MTKGGILHDYDLMANQEQSAQNQICQICDAAPMRFQWSDYHGEGMCTQCGCPYQLRGGTTEQEAEGQYPYINLKELLCEPLREYWGKTHQWTYLGSGFGRKPGLDSFITWVRNTYPELLT